MGEARARAKARWRRSVPRAETFECVQCRHRFTRHWGGFGREGFFCHDIAACNARMYENAKRGDPRFAHLVAPAPDEATPR